MRPRVTILGGFLGAGKTTILNAILRQADRRFAVIVNDFGAINVDAALTMGVEDTEGEVALSNGCICCSIRDDLLSALVRLCDREHPPEHILIETSGVSDPAAILGTFTQPGIDDLLELNAVVVAVDPESYPELTGSDWRLARRQVAIADLVISTKDDLVAADRRRSVEALIREDVPHARLVRSSRDCVPIELILGSIERLALRRHRQPIAGDVLDIHVHDVGTEQGHDHEHDDHTLVYSTWSFRTEAPLSTRRLRRALQRLPPTVFRVKGILHVTNRPKDRVVLQVVGRRAELYLAEPWGDAPACSEIVVIGARGTLVPDELQRLFEGCTCSDTDDGMLADMLGFFSRLLGSEPTGNERDDATKP